MTTNNYDNDATMYEDASTQTNKNNNEVEVKSAKGGIWKRTAVGAGAGIIIGGAASMLMGMKIPEHNILGEDDKPTHPDWGDDQMPVATTWVDDQVPVATTVSDDMSFSDAFEAARTEVGSGGVFEWHGQIYSTFTEEEWNNMTAEERAEYGEHFIWNEIDHSNSDVAQHSPSASSAGHTADPVVTQPESNDDDIEVVSVNQNQPTNTTIETDNPAQSGPVIADNIQEPEIEVLGVVHDEETGANIGGMTLDGQEVILIDVDGDMNFDYLAIDVNSNGQFEENEIADIHDQNLTVNDLGGFSDPTGGSIDSNIEPDYSNDVYVG